MCNLLSVTPAVIGGHSSIWRVHLNTEQKYTTSKEKSQLIKDSLEKLELKLCRSPQRLPKPFKRWKQVRVGLRQAPTELKSIYTTILQVLDKYSIAEQLTWG
ncbi:hypothetical protein A6R68_03340, partial [Neotoma lepida]